MSDPEALVEARRWLHYADQDLLAARSMLESRDFEPRHICWLAQQAAEKTIKAALVYEQIEFPWRHDLEALKLLLPETWHGRDQLKDLSGLTEWAVEARYPGFWPEATLQDAEIAIDQAQAVWDALSLDFTSRGFGES
jgi:HEPN domain-containing protein